MARQTWAALAALYPDNTAGAISPADLRAGLIDTMRPHVASDAPTASDDETLGFDVGHEWLDSSEPAIYKCRDATTGAAAWEKVWPQSGAGGGSAAEDVTYDNTSSGLTADDVQAAIDELASEKADSSSLAAVATSGAYSDLSGTPTLGTAAAEDVGAFATAAQGALADSAVQGDGITDVVAVTQAEYDLLTPDATTLYVITDA